MIHVSSVAALLYAACICCSTITSATRSLQSTVSLNRIDGFRVWATADMLADGDNWVVKDIKLFSNLDCTGTNYNDGTPISSVYLTNATYEYSPEWAFDADEDTSYWYGNYNNTNDNNENEYWVGMEFESAREVLCLSYLDYGSFSGNFYGAKKFRIEGREMSSGTWAEIMMVEEHQSGERQNITLPIFSTAPSSQATTSPSTAPSISLPPTSQSSSTPFPTLFVSLGCAAFLVLCGV